MQSTRELYRVILNSRSQIKRKILLCSMHSIFCFFAFHVLHVSNASSQHKCRTNILWCAKWVHALYQIALSPEKDMSFRDESFKEVKGDKTKNLQWGVLTFVSTPVEALFGVHTTAIILTMIKANEAQLYHLCSKIFFPITLALCSGSKKPKLLSLMYLGSMRFLGEE